jgi:hypothetical protein
MVRASRVPPRLPGSFSKTLETLETPAGTEHSRGFSHARPVEVDPDPRVPLHRTPRHLPAKRQVLIVDPGGVSLPSQVVESIEARGVPGLSVAASREPEMRGIGPRVTRFLNEASREVSPRVAPS